MRACLVLVASTVILTACTSVVTISCPGPAHDDWQDCDAKATQICPLGYETIERTPAPQGSSPTAEKSVKVRC
jgi:hypothetical protein